MVVCPAGVCECTILSCTGVPVVGEYKRGERGREAPKSLLSDRCKCQYRAPKSGNVFCESCVREDRLWKKEPATSFYRHKKDRSTCTGRSEVVVFSPNRGCAVNVYCRKYTVRHWRSWRRAWQASWETFSLAGIAPTSCGSSGRHGGCCGRYRPPCLSWRSAEGSIDGGLALVKVRTPPEGRPHASQGLRGRGSTGSRQHSGGNSARHVCTGVAGSHRLVTAAGMAKQ